MRQRWVSSPEYEAVAALLTEARMGAGLTQRQLAERLGKPHSYVAKIEGRERRVDVVEFVAIARAIGGIERTLYEKLLKALPPSS